MCYCFLRAVRKHLTSSSYTTELAGCRAFPLTRCNAYKMQCLQDAFLPEATLSLCELAYDSSHSEYVASARRVGITLTL